MAIAVVILLLVMCIAVDEATTIENNATKKVNLTHTDKNGYVDLNNGNSTIVVSSKDKIHTKKVAPTISMWAKPSVRCGYPYKWYYKTFIDYCPNCHHYNCLLKNPKGVPENEYTCRYCDSDFDGVVGKEKYSWSNVYLIKA